MATKVYIVSSDTEKFAEYNDKLIASNVFSWLPNFLPKDAKNITIYTHVETNYMDAMFYTLNHEIMNMNEGDATLTEYGKKYINDKWSSIDGFCKLGSNENSENEFYILIKLHYKKNFYAVVNNSYLIEDSCFIKPVLP